MKKAGVCMIAFMLVFSLAFAGGEREEAPDVDVDYTDNPWTDGQDLSGTRVNVFGAFVDEDARRFQAAMEPFEEATGIEVVYEGRGDFEVLITVRAEGGSPPDIAAFPQPGLAADLVRGGYVYDMADWLGMNYLSEQYNETWLDLAELEGSQAGVWYRASLKSLVWYSIPVFEKEGYEIPETWDEMLALTEQIKADGYVPWAVGIESSGATGWVLTDWIEDIMLRIHPPEVYDAWVEGELPFDSPEVREAFDIVADIWFEPGNVLGGREGIVLTPFGDAITPLLVDPPAAVLHRQASFIMGFMAQGGDEVGDSVGFFYLPPIDEDLGKPVLGAGDLMGAMRDRPEVRAAMRFLSQGISTKGWLERGGFLSPHADTPFEWYPTDADRGIAEILQNATTFRFDASDLMPGVVGAGTFWTEGTDWVNNPNADLGRILRNIDNSWPR